MRQAGFLSLVPEIKSGENTENLTHEDFAFQKVRSCPRFIEIFFAFGTRLRTSVKAWPTDACLRLGDGVAPPLQAHASRERFVFGISKKVLL